MYKLSSYNYYVKDNDRYIYFNGITNQVFSLSEKEHNNMQVLLSDLISFEIKYNSVFKRFIDWGFIIEKNLDEIDILRYRNKLATIDNKALNIIINPTLECNFHCWYCYEEHPKGHMNQDVICKIEKYIKHKIVSDRVSSVHISWFGGEPLLYFDEVVYPISKFAVNLCVFHNIPFASSITTNASKINVSMIEKMEEIEMKHFQITLDGVKNRHNKIRNEKGAPSYDGIMNNINDLCKNIDDVQITLRINYDNQTFKDCLIEEIFSNIPTEYRTKITPNFQRVWQTVKDNPVKNERRLDLYDHCRNMGFKVREPANILQIGAYYKCYADRFNHLEINYDGTLYFCTARSFTKEHQVGVFNDDGTIHWDQQKVIKRYAKATFENEVCLPCKYLPLCMGPCTQKLVETPKEHLSEICSLKYSEIPPETVIIEYYKNKMKALSID